jgi:hypothetical protein
MAYAFYDVGGSLKERLITLMGENGEIIWHGRAKIEAKACRCGGDIYWNYKGRPNMGKCLKCKRVIYGRK